MVGCDWLIRASALAARPGGPALLEQVCANAAQVAEWARWVGEKAPEGDVAAAGRDLLARFPHLPVHAAHFDQLFRSQLLDEFDALAGGVSATLINADNYAALRTLQPILREEVTHVYIDPPYNAPGTSEILYKNSFLHSSWAALISSRLQAASRLQSAEAVLTVAIDENEHDNLKQLLLRERKNDELHSLSVVHNPRGIQGDNFSYTHEYAVFCFQSGTKPIKRTPVPEVDWEYSNLRNWGGDSEREDGYALFYPLFIRDGKVIDIGDELPRDQHPKQRVEICDGYQVLWPIDTKGVERKWRYSRTSIRDLLPLLRVVGEGTALEVEIPRTTDAVKTVWSDPQFDAGVWGSKLLKRQLGLDGFSFPKSVHLVSRCLASVKTVKATHVLDFFAGSGTTGHAVINLNREDGGSRRFTLIEQGEYFDTVLLPRIAKVITCPEWKDGKPKPGVSMQPAAGEDPATHWSARTPELVKILRLERYEDALDALELPAEAEARAAGQESLGLDREVIRYLVASVAQGTTVRLATEKLATPFDYRLPCTQAGQHTTVAVDLVETAHLLLGLHPIRMRRLTDAPTGVAVIEEVRPHGSAADVRELVFWRTVDESLAGAALEQRMEAERDWLAAAVHREFGRALTDYRRVRHNRDALLPPGVSGESIDAALAQAMLERA